MGDCVAAQAGKREYEDLNGFVYILLALCPTYRFTSKD